MHSAQSFAQGYDSLLTLLADCAADQHNMLCAMLGARGVYGGTSLPQMKVRVMPPSNLGKDRGILNPQSGLKWKLIFSNSNFIDEDAKIDDYSNVVQAFSKLKDVNCSLQREDHRMTVLSTPKEKIGSAQPITKNDGNVSQAPSKLKDMNCILQRADHLVTVLSNSKEISSAQTITQNGNSLLPTLDRLVTYPDALSENIGRAQSIVKPILSTVPDEIKEAEAAKEQSLSEDGITRNLLRKAGELVKEAMHPIAFGTKNILVGAPATSEGYYPLDDVSKISLPQHGMKPIKWGP